MAVDGPDYQAWVEAQNDAPGDQTAYYLSNDFSEQNKLGQFYPNTTAPWWGQAAVYGITKAIDAAVGPRMTGTGSAPATFAGQNGQTYAAVGSNGLNLSGSTLMLLVGAAVLLVVMNSD